MYKIALVGYGKVGRAIYHAAQKYREMSITAVADPRFGHGLNPPAGVDAIEGSGRTSFPWKRIRPDLVIEASGSAVDRKSAEEHLLAGAKRVLVTSSMPDPDVTLISGVNEEAFSRNRHKIISASSCTTVCAAPLVNLIDREFGINGGRFIIKHGYDPKNIASDVDLNRVDADAVIKLGRGDEFAYRTNFVRNTEGVLPQLSGKMSAESYYTPLDRALFFRTSLQLKASPNAKEINERVIEGSEGDLKGILKYVDRSVNLCQIIPGNPFSTIFFGEFTSAGDGQANLYFGGDYINGYAARVLGLVRYLALKNK